MRIDRRLVPLFQLAVFVLLTAIFAIAFFICYHLTTTLSAIADPLVTCVYSRYALGCPGTQVTYDYVYNLLDQGYNFGAAAWVTAFACIITGVSGAFFTGWYHDRILISLILLGARVRIGFNQLWAMLP